MTMVWSRRVRTKAEAWTSSAPRAPRRADRSRLPWGRCVCMVGSCDARPSRLRDLPAEHIETLVSHALELPVPLAPTDDELGALASGDAAPKVVSLMLRRLRSKLLPPSRGSGAGSMEDDEWDGWDEWDECDGDEGSEGGGDGGGDAAGEAEMQSDRRTGAVSSSGPGHHRNPRAVALRAARAVVGEWHASLDPEDAAKWARQVRQQSSRVGMSVSMGEATGVLGATSTQRCSAKDSRGRAAAAVSACASRRQRWVALRAPTTAMHRAIARRRTARLQSPRRRF
jgi:hypothetical protein